jgi:TonB family protein
MKKSIFLFGLVLLLSICISGQTKPDYSGTWLFHKIVSPPDDKLQTVSIRMVIKQTPTEIKIGNNSGRSLIYPLGKESIVEAETSNGKIPIRVKSELTNKGKLNLNSEQTFKTDKGDITVKIKETFDISVDGKTLKAVREVQNSKGLPIIEMFIARKQAEEENSPNKTEDTVQDVSELKKQFSEGVLNGKAKHLETPSYPGAARANRVMGSVPVRVIFDEEGKVTFAQAIFGHPLLKSEAVEAAMKCKFEPVELNGKLIKVSGIILYSFRP